MKIGILQCGHAMDPIVTRFGDYPEMFETLLSGHDFQIHPFDVVNMAFPGDVADADGWLLSGSRHGVYDDLAFIPLLENFIREVYRAEIPMVGICFGHQIIARALGGRVEKFKDGWAIGPQVYDFDQLGKITLNAWHQDQVIIPPRSATTIARNDFCRHAALRYGDRALTVQAHPEFSNQIIAEFIRLRRGSPEYPDQVLASAQASVGGPINDRLLADQIAEFFKQSRLPR